MDRIDRLIYQRKIIQNDDVFSFSIDAILLAHFAKVPKRGHVVDLCAGNGAIGLMMSAKTEGAVDLVEIQPRLAMMAQKSVELSHLEGQITVINDDLKKALSYIKADSVDVVVCNPPYFTATDHSKINPNDHLAIARHELLTNLDEVLKISNQLLKTKGHFFMVHRPERLLDILQTMEKYQIMPKRLQFIYPKKDKEANIVLIEGIKLGKKSGLKVLPALIVHEENGEYTKEMQAIFDE